MPLSQGDSLGSRCPLPTATADCRYTLLLPTAAAHCRCLRLATNDLDDCSDYTTPAMSNGRLFIKGNSYLWCIGGEGGEVSS